MRFCPVAIIFFFSLALDEMRDGRTQEERFPCALIDYKEFQACDLSGSDDA
jgi:hypothetical protein